MPQLPERFSAYPVATRLDANGDGTIRFQATGANIVITNLYVAVSTSVLQAKCTLYKGQVAASNAISNTNSGSTGASAVGRIELLDGESVFVVWDGGDASAQATATFSGVTIPFSTSPDEGGTDFAFTDPFAAGDGTIIFPALKSPNYVQGVSGWKIDRDGTVEFGDGTFRGDLEIIDPATGQGMKAHSTPWAGIELFPQGSYISTGSINWTSVSSNGIYSVVTPTVSGGTVPSLFMFERLAPTGLVSLIDTDLQVTEGRSLISRRMGGDNLTAATTPVTAETVEMTASCTLTTGRVYRAEFTGSVASNTSATDVLMRVRKTNAAGTQVSVARVSCRLLNTSYSGDWSCLFTPATAGAVDIVLTIGANPSVGQTVIIAAAATSQADFVVYDHGSTDEYPNVAMI